MIDLGSIREALVRSPKAPIIAAAVVPLFFGFYSVILGADANWDLYNYHLYAPFALLNGKLSIDLAPAGFQGYFNPLLDLPVYLLNRHFPPMLSGFIQGFVHGTVFILLMGIAFIVLPIPKAADRHRLPILIALSGCFTGIFLSEVGNSMGDNTTAILILGSVYVLTSRWCILADSGIRPTAVLVAAGLLAGLAMGLKPTNAPPAFSICVALLICHRGNVLTRLRLPLVVGVAALAGFTITGGYWMIRLWIDFRNPLFPQFSSIFPNPLVLPMGVADTRWLPRSVLENILWPFFFSINPHRVGELSVKQAIWPIAYLTAGVWLLRRLFWRGKEMPTMKPEAAFVLLFIASSYLLWMKIFSISRYMVSFEVLLPIALFVLLSQLFNYNRARSIAAWLLSVTTIIVILGGARSWGHEGWGSPLYHTDAVSLPEASTATVLLASPEKATAWLATLFPPETAFIGVASSFPESANFAKRARDIARTRGGPIFVITDGEDDKSASRAAYFEHLATWVGLTTNKAGCRVLQRIVTTFGFKVDVTSPSSAGDRCQISVAAGEKIDIATSDNIRVERAAAIITRKGFDIDRQSCSAFTAGIGAGSQRFQLCKARLLFSTD